MKSQADRDRLRLAAKDATHAVAVHRPGGRRAIAGQTGTGVEIAIVIAVVMAAETAIVGAVAMGETAARAGREPLVADNSPLVADKSVRPTEQSGPLYPSRQPC
jgi:hypothetical protein